MKRLWKVWLWKMRLRRCWRQAAGDLGEFYGCVGYYVARGFLPIGILRYRCILRRVRV